MILIRNDKLSDLDPRAGITLTCKSGLIIFYEILGFENRGVPESAYDGVK